MTNDEGGRGVSKSKNLDDVILNCALTNDQIKCQKVFFLIRKNVFEHYFGHSNIISGDLEFLTLRRPILTPKLLPKIPVPPWAFWGTKIIFRRVKCSKWPEIIFLYTKQCSSTLFRIRKMHCDTLFDDFWPKTGYFRVFSQNYLSGTGFPPFLAFF